MKRLIVWCLSAGLLLPVTGCGSKSKEASGEFIPKKNVEFFVTSSAGGGSDTFARTIVDAIGKGELCDQTFLVDNQTDGNGEVGRLTVAQTKGASADYTLLSMNSGDCGDMLTNTKNRIENFRPIATMAVDKQLLFTGKGDEYSDFKSILNALEAGETVIMGGSKGSDTNTYETLLKELGVDATQFKYIVYDSSSDALTAILGGHIDVVISKPGAALQYVEAGSILPVLALSTTHFPGNLANAPTLSEVDDRYEDVECPIWRAVVGPASMSDEAVAYWSQLMKSVSESDVWNVYLEKNSLLNDYRSAEDTQAYLAAFQADFLEAEAK